AFALGAGAALALSGKFLGAFTVVLSLVLLSLGAPGIDRPRRLKGFAAFLIGLVAFYVLCNLPVVTNFADFKAGLDREVKLVVEGQRGTTRSVPHSVYLTAFQKNIFFVFWIPLA